MIGKQMYEEYAVKRGQIVDGMVRSLDFPNRGLVEVEESREAIAQGADPTRLVAVKNVLPGQRVRLRLKRTGRGRSQGSLMEILAKAPNELQEAACPHFADCGGCAYQNLAYEDQLTLKEEQVRRLMKPVLGEEFDRVFEGVTASPMREEYRNKMEFSFGDREKGGSLALGMHRRSSFYDIVPVDQCRIINQDMRDVLRLTLDFFRERKMSFYHKLRHEGYLRHLLVRRSQRDGSLMADLVTSGNRVDREGEPFTEGEERRLLDDWKQALLEHAWEGELTGLLHTRNDSPADVIEDQGTDILYGSDLLTEEILGLRFDITPFSFFQTNSSGAEVLYETARGFIRGAATGQGDGSGLEAIRGKNVFDLYSGTGTIAQILAPAAGHVVGVEIVEEAVGAARSNAEKNGLHNCDFIAGDVLKVLDDIAVKPDFIVLDPPRDGIHPKALTKIIDYGAPAMVYISCKPTSLARDLEVLIARGYRVDRMRCVDMFPGTVHVETVALLSKLDVDKHIDVEIKLDELDLTSAESKASYAQIKEYILEKFDLKVSTLYIAQIKKKYGIVLRENYNKSKKEKQFIPQCTPEKEEAIMDALRHFKMI